jgi:hypothetical protein
MLILGAATLGNAIPINGISLNGSTCLTVRNGKAFDLPAFSIATWVKLPKTDGTQVLINRGRKNSLMTLYLENQQICFLVEYANDETAIVRTPAPKLNTWTHYLGTYDGHEVRLYVNGVPVSSAKAEGRIPASDAPLVIGSESSSAYHTTGTLEEVQVWNKALDEAEARQAASAGIAAKSALIGRWQKSAINENSYLNAAKMELNAVMTGKLIPSSSKDTGYRGIWFTLEQFTKYGDKYSGGLGTYTADHIPIAIYVPKVNKTFFVYGGTIQGTRHLLIMASYYDHARQIVPRPTIVHDKEGVSDPHDNASLSIDKEGYLWVFVSGRAKTRPGFKYRSHKPYSVDQFDLISTEEMTYPQPWYIPGKGFINCFTKYTKGRELYWETSPDGKTWSDDQKLAGFGGHYQVTNQRNGRIITAFNWHPGGIVDKRTNLYFLQTNDMGKTWKTIEGKAVATPLNATQNEAMVREYQKEGSLVYIHDINFDKNGNPVILYIVSKTHLPGPESEMGPRIWTIAHWTGINWEYHEITHSDHNYDTGSLYIEEDGTWRVIGPTEPGPQPDGTGGEIAMWISRNEGVTWVKVKDITKSSRYNHSYARRPLNAHPDFYSLWADGDPYTMTESRLYFCNKTGDKVWVLPYDMKGEFEHPHRVQTQLH